MLSSQGFFFLFFKGKGIICRHKQAFLQMHWGIPLALNYLLGEKLKNLLLECLSSKQHNAY